MRKFTILFSLSLAACGGGGSNEVEKTASISSTPASTVTAPKPYFIEIQNALETKYPFENTVSIAATTLDINQDGMQDLVMHYWAGRPADGTILPPENLPCPNELRVFILQPNKTFSDQTQAYIPGSKDIGGCGYKIEKEDINNDGKLDILYSVSQEDGRKATFNYEPEGYSSSNHDAQLAALVSDGNIYRVVRFARPRWYHSVGTGIDNDGKIFATGAGYTGGANTTVYYWNDQGLFSAGEIGLPFISPNTFRFYNRNGDKKETTLLLQAAGAEPIDSINIEGYQKVNGSWQRLPNHNPFGPSLGKFGDAPFTIHRYKDRLIAGAAYSQSCVMKLNPSGEQIVVFKMHFSYVKEPFTDGMPVGNTFDQSTSASVYRGVKIEGDRIVEVPLNIKDEVLNDSAGNYYDCTDVNKDGYDDIVSYPYTDSGTPFVYINNKDNSFRFINQSVFPDTFYKTNWDRSSSILRDFDGDGFADLLVWYANGISLPETPKFRFFLGQKHITD